MEVKNGYRCFDHRRRMSSCRCFACKYVLILATGTPSQQIKLEKLKGKLNMGKSIALSSALIFHYILVLFIGLGLTTWGLVGSLSLGTFSILLTTAIIGTGLVWPATIVCMLLIGLGVFNGLWIFPLVTAAGISICMLSD